MATKYTPAEIRNDEGTVVLARVCSVDFGCCIEDHEVPPFTKIRRYTAFCDSPRDPGEYEEIDLDAVNARHAKACAEIELKASYEPGMRVAHVEERMGLYM